MTAPVDRDREELARVLRGALVRPPVGGETNWDRALRIAAALAPLVARREARAAAKALNDAADDMPGRPGTNPAQDWLLARAAALDTEGKDR